MGLFHRQKPTQPVDETSDGVQRFFNDYFHDLRKRGHDHFGKIMKENTTIFKQDLDATIFEVNAELKQYITKWLEDQFAAYTKIMKDAQDVSLNTLNQSTQELQQQHAQLGVTLHKNIEYQEAMLTNVFEKSRAQVAAMQEAQAKALDSLTQSTQALEAQRQEIGEAIKKNATEQQELLIAVFEEHMGEIIEHYVTDALGDQYDLKTQLPAIIQQLESNKQAIVDDMKL